MENLAPVASALGLGMLAGARLYATVFVIGLLVRFGWIALPAAWQQASVLADTRVLIASGLACAIEFVADKIPWVDSAWDSIHTFVRPIGAALLTTSLFSNLDPAYQVLLFLLAGGVAFSGHSAKAAARLAVNHSPEPFTNAAASLAEDALVAAGLYLLVKHPWVMAGIALAFLVLFLWLAPRVWRALRAEWAAFAALLRSWFGCVRRPELTGAQQRWLRENGLLQPPRRLLSAIGTGDVKGLRNALGTLCLYDREAVFFARRWGLLKARRFGPLHSTEMKKRFFVDRLTLVDVEGRRVRFDLPAGQLARAAGEASRQAPPAPVQSLN